MPLTRTQTREGPKDLRDLAPIEVLVGSERFPTTLARVLGVWGVGTSALGLVALVLPRSAIPGLHVVPIACVLAAGIVVPSLLLVRPRWFSPNLLWLIGLAVAATGGLLVSLMGPRLEVGFAWLSLGVAVTPVWFGRRKAAAVVVVLAISLSIALTLGGHFPSPAGQVLFVVGVTAIGAVFLDWTITEVRRLALQERNAHEALRDAHAQLEEAHRELATLNRTLESRVSTQVAEIEALSRLRRFLSPQVAEAVLAGRDEVLLQPHRRQIAAFFSDLRGFTAFTSSAEPEEVVDALDHYYRVVGEVLHRHQATVGAFAGDGIMAYLNDPVPCEDPPRTAVEMALALKEPMGEFLAVWKRRGFDLGYGVGIAYGYATLGSVGFEGRSDYTALGSVVNLAARLCGEASPGQVLIDSRTADALEDLYELIEREVVLKGFATPIRAHEVAGFAP